MTRRLLHATLILLFSATLLNCDTAPQEFRHQFLAFGTLVEVTLYDVDQATAEAAISAIEKDFEWMGKAWYPWYRGSLRRVNGLLAHGEWFSVAPSVRPLIVAATPLAEQSEHLFNPAVGRLVEMWNFHQFDSEQAMQPPQEEDIKEWLSHAPKITDIEFSDIRIRSTNPMLKLDFGAFAKGYGIDQEITRMKEMGIKNAILNAGGDMRVIGRRQDRPWRIAIRHPRKANSVFATIEVQGDESIFTSGDYERFYEHAGKRFHHILDPRTGRPARGTQSVTVIHPHAATADAAATALFVAGPQDYWRIAKKMGIRHVMLIDDQGRVHMNPAMQKRVKLEVDPKPEVILSAPLQ